MTRIVHLREDMWQQSRISGKILKGRVHQYFGYQGFELTKDLCHWGSQVAKSRNDEDGPSEGGHMAAIQDFRKSEIRNLGVPLTRGWALVLISPEGNKTVVL